MRVSVEAMYETYEFAEFRLDVRERTLSRLGGERVALPDKAFDTLCVLVRNAGRLVEKEDLLKTVWADAFVEDNNLNKSIHAIRRALGDQNGEPRFVETVKKHGFRFVADVRPISNGNGLNAVIATNGNGHHPAEVSAQRMEAAPPVDERTVDGVLSRPLLASIAVIICVVAGAGFYSWFAPASQAPKQFSILVLPVQPLDPNGGDEVLRLGIADAVIQRLNGTEGVVVRSLFETRRFVGAEQDPLAAGRAQKVDYVLASTYQAADGKFRVTGQLINVSTGQVEETLKSEIDLTGKFAMQDAVAADLSSRVLRRFGAGPGNKTPKRGTSNEEAYAAYLQGMYLLDKTQEEPQSAQAAIAAFDRAIALDPNYAAAWAGKGHSHCANSHNVGSKPPDEEYKVAEPALQRALQLDPDNAEAHVVLGMIAADYKWDWANSEKYFRRAIEINPTLDYARRWYGLQLVRAGRVDEGLTQLKEAMRLNPASIHYQVTHGLALFLGQRYDEAQVQLEKLSEMAPEIDFVHGVLWQVHHRKGDGARAYEQLRKYLGMDPRRAEFIMPFEAAYRSGGWAAALSAYQKKRAANVPEGYWPGHYFMATLSVYAGDREQAFRSLEDAVKYRLYDVPFMRFDPALEPIRSDPRFADLVRRSGVK